MKQGNWIMRNETQEMTDEESTTKNYTQEIIC